MRATQALSWHNGERAEVLSHYDPTLQEPEKEEVEDKQMELWKEQEDATNK